MLNIHYIPSSKSEAEKSAEYSALNREYIEINQQVNALCEAVKVYKAAL